MKDTRGRIAKIICYSYQMLKSIVTWLLYKIKLKIIDNNENNLYKELNQLTNSLIIYFLKIRRTGMYCQDGGKYRQNPVSKLCIFWYLSRFEHKSVG